MIVEGILQRPNPGPDCRIVVLAWYSIMWVICVIKAGYVVGGIEVRACEEASMDIHDALLGHELDCALDLRLLFEN